MATTRKSPSKKPAKAKAKAKAISAKPRTAAKATTASKPTSKAVTKTAAKTVTRAAPAPRNPTVEAVRELAGILHKYGLAEITVDLRRETVNLRATGAEPLASAAVVSTSPMMTVAAAPTGDAVSAAAEPAPAVAPVDTSVTVTSPFVGTFYRAPSPEVGSFVDVGDRVTKGQVLCIVEAMKLMNEIEADSDGVVQEILVENAQSVEYGQALFKIGK